MMQQWADYIDDLRTRAGTAGNVIPMPKKYKINQ